MIEELKDELYLYNFLRQLFLKEPTKELITDISKIDMRAEIDGEINHGLKLMIDAPSNNLHSLD